MHVRIRDNKGAVASVSLEDTVVPGDTYDSESDLIAAANTFIALGSSAVTAGP